MADLDRLKAAFMKAHEAGNTEDARVLAGEIKRLQQQKPAAKAVKPPAQPTAQQQLMYMPDEFTGEATQAAKEFLPGFGTAALQGLTFGLSDEIGAGVEGLKALARGEKFMPAAKQRMAESAAERAEFREQYPKSAIAGEILGSLPLGVAGGVKLAARQAAKGTGRLASIGQQALMAGAGGAVAGAGGAEGGIEQRAKSAAISGLIGGGLGAAGAALPTGRLMPSPETRQALSLLDEGVPLTVGQQLGGPVAYAENLLGKTLVGDIAGISSAQRKAFEGFSKNFIQDALEPIGVKIPKGMDVNKAAKFAEKTIKSNFKAAVDKANLSDAAPVLEMMEAAIKPKSIGDIDLNLDDIKEVRNILQKSVASNIFENQMTGQMVQKSLKALNSATKKADLSDNAKQVIRTAKENLEGILVSQNKNNETLINARKAYRNMFPMKAAVKKGGKRGAFTPQQAAEALESAKYADSPMYEGVKRAEGVLAGSVPSSEGTAGLLTLPKLATGGGLYAAGAQALPALAGMASIYRTGPLGAAVAREILSTPGYLARSLAAAPAVSGMTGGLLAEQE